MLAVGCLLPQSSDRCFQIRWQADFYKDWGQTLAWATEMERVEEMALGSVLPQVEEQAFEWLEAEAWE
jgi:hypothetical protein